jgi:hypothetical protein
MDNQPQTANANPGADKFLVKVYEEICINIRTSDDISFKLLGLVPLISGSGAAILTLNKIWAETSSITILLISILAAVITFGLFKWEMRNVQKCDWLVARAAALEKSYFHLEAAGEKRVISQYDGWMSQERPPLFGKIPEFRTGEEAEKCEGRSPRGKRVGKTQAERIIYWASIAAWLIPMVTALMRWKVCPGI